MKKPVQVPHPAKEIKSERISAGLFACLTPETLIAGGASLLSEHWENREFSQCSLKSTVLEINDTKNTLWKSDNFF